MGADNAHQPAILWIPCRQWAVPVTSHELLAVTKPRYAANSLWWLAKQSNVQNSLLQNRPPGSLASHHTFSSLSYHKATQTTKQHAACKDRETGEEHMVNTCSVFSPPMLTGVLLCSNCQLFTCFIWQRNTTALARKSQTTARKSYAKRSWAKSTTFTWQ